MTEEARTRRRLPSWAQGLLLAIAGAVLGVGGCLVWLNDPDSTLGNAGAMLFEGALLAVVIGGIWFVVGVVKALTTTERQLTDD